MKTLTHVATVLMITAVLVLFGVAVQQTTIAKDKNLGSECASCDLDKGYSILTGQRGFYQLTDDEGGVDKAFGRKCPAVLSAPQVVEVEGGRFLPVRGLDGTIQVCVTVFRPASKGGTFDKCGAAYGSREPGGFDIVQSGDLKGF